MTGPSDAAAPPGARGQALRGAVRLDLLVFVVGISTLGAEIAAARLMAPFFGASTIVWANTIAVVLVALSVGYWFGGRLADRRPDHSAVCALALAASALLGLVPVLAGPFLELSVDAFDSISIGTFAGSLLGVLALFAVPVLMLGAVSPWAIRLKLHDVADAGRVAGRMYAISTLGSLLGTFLSALLLIPVVGTQRTFIALALMLALVAVWGVGIRGAPVPLLLAGLLFLPAGTIKSGNGSSVIHEEETEYQYARVVEDRDGERRLELNEGQAVHSVYRPDGVLTGGVWDGYLVAPFAVMDRPQRTVAIMGFGAGTTARAYERYFPSTRIDGVEIDGELVDIGHRLFGLRARDELRTYAEDARPFLRRTRARYDAIFMDAYRQPYVPFYLATSEFFSLARDRLTPGGVVVVNVGHPKGSDVLERTLTATLRSVFDHVSRDPIKTQSTLLIAADAAPSADRLRRAARTLHPDLRPLAVRAADRLSSGLSRGDVYTDDRAPVEWLIDESILRYATDE